MKLELGVKQTQVEQSKSQTAQVGPGGEADSEERKQALSIFNVVTRRNTQAHSVTRLRELRRFKAYPFPPPPYLSLRSLVSILQSGPKPSTMLPWTSWYHYYIVEKPNINNIR